MWNSSRFTPKQDVRGNIHFSPFGVYAYWILTPPDKPLADELGLQRAAQAHWELGNLLDFKPGLAGTSSLSDPKLVRAKMTFDVDADLHPYYNGIVIARENEAHGAQTRFPVYWVWVRLDPHRGSLNPLHMLKRTVVDLGFLAPKPTAENVEKYFAVMQDVEKHIPPSFRPARPTSAQIRWFYHRQITHGAVDKPIPLPNSTDGMTVGYRWQPWIDIWEGPKGQESTVGAFTAMTRVDSHDDNVVTSYQVHLGVSAFPQGGIYFPGSKFTEIMSNLSHPVTGEPIRVDWTQRARRIRLSKTRKKIQDDQRKISEQEGQQAGRTTGHELMVSAEALQAYEQELSAGPQEAEIVYTTVFSVGADSARKAMEHAEAVKEALAGLGIEAEARNGQQRRMFRAIRPGPRDNITDTFVQFTTRAGWSRYIPFTSTRAGDQSGRAIGVNKTSGDLDFVYVNDRGAARQVQFGGAIYGGDPRTGKTHACMRDILEEAMAGARAVILDNTEQWKKLIQKVPDAFSVNLAFGQFTVDQMVYAPGPLAAENMGAALVKIAGVDPKGPAASAMRLALNDQGGRRFSSIAHFLGWITSKDPTVPAELKEFGDMLLSWASSPSAAPLLGVIHPETGERVPLPVLPLDKVTMAVIETQDLALPTEADLKAAAEGIPLDTRQIIAQAVITEFARYVRAVFYRDKHRLDKLVIEEGWRLNWMYELKMLAYEILRTGPANNVDVAFISQKPWKDFPDLDLDLSARNIFMFRIEALEEAKKAARFMNVDVDRWPSVAEEITQLSPRPQFKDAFGRPMPVDEGAVPRTRRGECLAKIGTDLVWVKTFEMALPEWEQAADTTPERV
ncbi:ATP-binding protein [Mycobacteroides abscessus]|uniref:ATP-binding protein n=1 Tax=Mycobacteroides abscessus TaxID=36809 RepID=UPI0012FFF7ED|nr:ATP-binding protein [Mycobacteroides abscessus]